MRPNSTDALASTLCVQRVYGVRNSRKHGKSDGSAGQPSQNSIDTAFGAEVLLPAHYALNVVKRFIFEPFGEMLRFKSAADSTARLTISGGGQQQTDVGSLGDFSVFPPV
jgi:hypothetical protein